MSQENPRELVFPRQFIPHPFPPPFFQRASHRLRLPPRGGKLRHPVGKYVASERSAQQRSNGARIFAETEFPPRLLFFNRVAETTLLSSHGAAKFRLPLYGPVFLLPPLLLLLLLEQSFPTEAHPLRNRTLRVSPPPEGGGWKARREGKGERGRGQV